MFTVLKTQNRTLLLNRKVSLGMHFSKIFFSQKERIEIVKVVFTGNLYLDKLDVICPHSHDGTGFLF